MGYGIGRVPKDVDSTREDIAKTEAREEIKKLQSDRNYVLPNRPKTCSNCGRTCSELMSSSNGSVCPDCYDKCSD